MKNSFSVIDDAIVILRSKGVYRQVKAYERNGKIYAGHGSGFVQISNTGGTSVPNIRVDSVDLGFEPVVAPFGYLEMPSSKAPGWSAQKAIAAE